MGCSEVIPVCGDCCTGKASHEVRKPGRKPDGRMETPDHDTRTKVPDSVGTDFDHHVVWMCSSDEVSFRDYSSNGVVKVHPKCER